MTEEKDIRIALFKKIADEQGWEFLIEEIEDLYEIFDKVRRLLNKEMGII